MRKVLYFRNNMTKLILCIAALVWTAALPAQKNEASSPALIHTNRTCKADFERITLEGKNDSVTIRQFLQKQIGSLKDSRSGLSFNYRNESLGGFHYSFSQTYQGIPVYQSEIKVNTDRKNTVLSVLDNSYETADWNLNTAGADEHSVIYVFPETGNALVASLNNTDPFREIIELNGRIVYERDTRSYFAAPDSTVSGKAFNPDPLTTAGQVYDTNTVYKHNNNANATWIEAQLQTVNFKADFDGITFRLNSPYVIISDFDTPAVAPVVSTLPQFYYSRPHSGLEDVNAYYHTSFYRNYVASLGFNCVNRKINLDTHAANGADQSFFSPNYIPPRIYFGTGGVPDAQDADVIIHEYAHFMSENASPVSNIGYERTSLDEGFCDYLAASYSSSINTFHEDRVFNWDGHNEFWNGRMVATTKKYPQDITFNSIYRDGEIWSSALFQISKDIGITATDSLIIETHYNYAQNLKMNQAAQLLIISDSVLNFGANYCPVYKRLYERGLMPFRANPCGISSISNEAEPSTAFSFMQDGHSFQLMAEQHLTEPVTVEIYSLNGERLLSLPVSFSSHRSFAYRNDFIATGMYVVYVKSGVTSGAFKWAKIQ